jgi:hypothetical protein
MRSVLLFAAVLFLAHVAFAQDPLRIEGDESSHLSNKFCDGGIPSIVGVQNIQVFRASRTRPDLTGDKGWTYNHHIDICCWKGKLYVAWTNGEKDEDTWPAHEVFSTSTDGVTWSAPKELFPFGLTNPLRMYFYHTAGGKMLVIDARRITHDKIDDVAAGGIVVRELQADGSLGPVYTLIKSPLADSNPPFFTDSTDKPFVEACNQLLADHTYLEQEDFGELLGDHRMAPFDSAPDDFGKAFCFYYRKDGTLVGICKKGYVVESTDNGKTWGEAVKLQDFTAGTAKEWVQQTADGKFIWAHDPFPVDRFPLVAMTGDDGVNFANMRVVHGEIPRQRYEGLNKNIGAQYVRGISFWNTDGSRNDNAIWLAYSVNKEDIWVSRIPLPIRVNPDAAVDDDFSQFPPGKIVAGWNTYAPRWTDVSVDDSPDGKSLRLEDHDPYDYARASRVFPSNASVKVTFDLLAKHVAPQNLEIELWQDFDDVRPVRIVLAPDGTISSGATKLGTYAVNQWLNFKIDATATTGKFSVSINNAPPVAVDFAEKADSFSKIVFRTGEYRDLPTRGDEIPANTDKPSDSSEYLIRNLVIR